MVMNFNEGQLAGWAARPSVTETTRMINAENAVKKAIASSEALNSRNIKVFAQGSYRNRVNVKADSDVDIGVLCTDSFFWDGGPEGATLASLGYAEAQYRYADFRNDVGTALRSYFGNGAVTEGDKAFDIKSNTYRVDADVAPFFVHKRFANDGSFIEGVEMSPKSGGNIRNWPDQHYANGVAKNAATSRSFKGCVRILKTLRYKMKAEGYASAKDVPSFLIECLVFNVPDDHLGGSTWVSDIRNSLVFLYHATTSDAECSEWGEVSELKYLFRPNQPWTREKANTFVYDCWNYMGFE